jgi:chromosome segregation ATPase
MLTLESLKTEVDDLREICRMTDSNAMETRQLLTAQTSTVNALRADQMVLRGLIDQQGRVLAGQGIGIGSLAIIMNQTQQEVHSLRTDVHDLKVGVTGLQLTVYELKSDVKDLKADVKIIHERLDGLETRLDGLETRLDGLETRMDRLEGRQDRMDRNLVAIMRHLGVEPVAA